MLGIPVQLPGVGVCFPQKCVHSHWHGAVECKGVVDYSTNDWLSLSLHLHHPWSLHGPHSYLGDEMGDQPQLLHLCGQVKSCSASLPLCSLHFSPIVHQQIQALGASGMDCQVYWVQP